MVNGAHLKDALAMGQLKVAALQHHRADLDNINNAEQHHKEGQPGAKGQRDDHAAHKKGAGIAHEYLGGVMVPEQEADAAAAQCPRHDAHFSHAQQVAEDEIADGQYQRHGGKQAIQAIGEIDSIGKGNDGKHGKHIIEYPKIVGADIGNGYHGGLRAADVQKQQVHRAKQNLQRHLLLFGQALILLFYDLQVVIEEADGPE